MNTEHTDLSALRHTCSHLLAAAVMELWPDAKRTIGPAINTGFYFDFEFSKPIDKTCLPKIEEKMHQIVKLWTSVEKHELTVNEAKKEYPNNPYKHELIDKFSKESPTLTFYQSGNYRDLCEGGHIHRPDKQIKHFKLLSIAGAYWHGDEKNKMLTRIYGTCFPTKKELDKHLWQLEEAKKRDHRALGKKLELYVIDENIGKGLPLLTPKGTILRKQILDYEYQLEVEAGFQQVTTPHIARSHLYKKTGHWQHYRDVMYAPFGIEGEEYVLKPMNCPHHYMIYASKPRSYRDLPIRLSEPGTCYRFEKTGELSGLLRVRALSIDDAHILMREDQIESEFKRCIEMVAKMFKAFSLHDYYVRLSLSDPSDAIKYIADAATWNKAGRILEKIVKDNKLAYKVGKGEASFYGPKIDYMVKDSLGREWQMSTLQLDLFMSKKLNLAYVDENGKERRPIILHRGLTGSIERTMAVLIEHFNGAFPLWLAPIQAVIIPISEKHVAYAKKAVAKLASPLIVEQARPLQVFNLRIQLDDRNSPMGAKVRDASLQKVPYVGIIGDKEMAQPELALSVRTRNRKNMGQLTISQFTKHLVSEIENKR